MKIIRDAQPNAQQNEDVAPPKKHSFSIYGKEVRVPTEYKGMFGDREVIKLNEPGYEEALKLTTNSSKRAGIQGMTEEQIRKHNFKNTYNRIRKMPKDKTPSTANKAEVEDKKEPPKKPMIDVFNKMIG